MTRYICPFNNRHFQTSFLMQGNTPHHKIAYSEMEKKHFKTEGSGVKGKDYMVNVYYKQGKKETEKVKETRKESERM